MANPFLNTTTQGNNNNLFGVKKVEGDEKTNVRNEKSHKANDWP